jgi:hypothetical protein
MAPARGTCGTVESVDPETTIGTKICARTRRTIPLACFNKNKHGKAMVYCVTCQVKAKLQSTAYFKTDHGKTKKKIQNDKPESKKSKKTYRESEEGRTKAKVRTNTDEHRAKTNTFSKTVSGKVIRKRSYSKHKLATDLMNGFARMMRGGDSPKTIKATSFRSAADARAHMREQLSDGMTTSNYGSVWSVDHRIPKSAYDHSDPEDVRRCWSKPNMHPMHSTANKEKLTTLLPEEVAKVPQELWPKAWEGVARTA